ncbi:MAG: hypothetical protein FJX19_02845, partial [Alphaproteobacteria bacterium]|nr:hypothetical protein [Alphaproteobacteria bacterium]
MPSQSPRSGPILPMSRAITAGMTTPTGISRSFPESPRRSQTISIGTSAPSDRMRNSSRRWSLPVCASAEGHMAELEADVDAAWRMAFLGARQIAAQETVFVGIGAPCQAAMLARRLGNADMTMIFESGVIGADPQEMPLSTGSPSVAKGAKMTTDMLGVFALLQRGGIGLGILSGAEVDAAGNLNSTVLGSYAQPRLRLPGSGGAHDIALLCRRLM